MSSRFSLRRSALGAAAIAIALGGAGCGSSGSGNADVDPASVLPANSPVYFEVTVRPKGELKTNVEAVAKKILRTGDPGAEIVKGLDQLLDDGDSTNFKDDIDPWLGDKAAVAITSLRNPQSPDFAIAIASKDNDKAMKALEDKDTTEAEYSGVKYLKQKKDDFAGGTVGDTLVIGNEAGFKSAVDAEKADEQLDDSKALADARKSVSEDAPLGFLFVDLAKAITAIGASQPLIASQIEPLKKLLGGATTISAAITVVDDAIRIESAQIGGPAAAMKGDPAKALADLPAGTVLGVGLGQIGTAFKKGLDQLTSIGPIAGQDPQTLLSGLEAQIGLSIEDDLLSWMGEGAIFAQGKSIADIGGGLLVRSTNPGKTKAALKKIEPLLKQFGVPVVSTPPQGAEAGFRVPLQEGGALDLLVGLKGDRFVVGVNPNLIQKTLNGSSEGRLGDEAAFKAAAAKLGDGIKPSFYLDFPAIVGFLALGAGSDPDFQKAKPYLDAFSAIVAGGKHEGNVSRGRFVIGVK